jgi:hypothetical protein
MSRPRLSLIFLCQLIITAAYLFIASGDGIVQRLVNDPQGYYIVQNPYITQTFSFFQKYTLNVSSAIYTISVFEVLIMVEIAATYVSLRSSRIYPKMGGGV